MYSDKQKVPPLKAIRKKCLDCAGFRGEVNKCPVVSCSLHPFRFGKNPFRKKTPLTDKQKKDVRKRLVEGKDKKNGD